MIADDDISRGHFSCDPTVTCTTETNPAAHTANVLDGEPMYLSTVTGLVVLSVGESVVIIQTHFRAVKNETTGDHLT